MSYIGTKEFFLEIAKGNVAGHTIVHKFGRNPSVAASSTEDVWSIGGAMNWETSAAVVSLTSDDANDDGTPTTNTGAQTVIVEGLDANWDEQTSTVTLAGLSAATTGADTYLRVNRAYVDTVGTYHGTNIGNITGTINGNNAMYIAADQGQTQLGRYSVPNGKTAYVHAVYISVSSSKSATIRALRVPNADDTSQPYSGVQRLWLEFDDVVGEESITYDGGVKFSQKTDIWFEASTGSGAAAAVEVEFEIILVDN